MDRRRGRLILSIPTVPTMATSKPDPLEFLQQHFEALEPRNVDDIPGFPYKLVFHPLNAEQTLKLGKAVQEKNASARAIAYAELMAETVKLEDGKPAFPFAKDKPNPIEVLTRKTPPKIFTAMVNVLIDWITAEAQELPKK